MAHYTEPIDGGDLFSISEFKRDVNSHCLIDDDGYGHPVKDGMMDPSIDVYPSEVSRIPSDATHIVWYNR